jgi:hypothetical protein
VIRYKDPACLTINASKVLLSLVVLRLYACEREVNGETLERLFGCTGSVITSCLLRLLGPDVRGALFQYRLKMLERGDTLNMFMCEIQIMI